MKTRNVAVILLRLAALYFLYTTLINALRTHSYLSSDNSMIAASASAVIVIQVLLPLVAFFLLWFFPNTWARLIVKTSQNETIKPMNSIEWLRIIILAMGFYMATWAILDAIYWSIPLMMMLESDANTFMIEQKAAMITTVVEFVVGLMLITKNTWVAQTLLKVNAPESKTATHNNNQID